jgi:hypothetical protein
MGAFYTAPDGGGCPHDPVLKTAAPKVNLNRGRLRAMVRRMWKYVSNNALLAGLVVLFVSTLLGVWRWSDLKAFFGTAAGALAAALQGARGWLEAPTSVPRWLLLLILVSIVLLARMGGRHGKRLSDVERMFFGHIGERHALPLPEPPREPDPEKVVEGFAPTPGQLALLQKSGWYAHKVAFKDARRVLEGIDPTATWDDATRALKILKEAGAVTLYGPNGTDGYALTSAGHRFMDALKERKRI